MKSDIGLDPIIRQRDRMVRIQLRDRGIRDERVLRAMASVPRHEFVSESLRHAAYEDHPLPIGEEQTISQPFIVALMLQALLLEPNCKVLEIGTGCGYQTALLCQLVAEVFSMERHAALARAAEGNLARLGCQNVRIVVGDGKRGLPDCAPYDAIIVSAAASQIPPALLEQLAEAGRMVIPVGTNQVQELQLVRKIEGRPSVSILEGCRFVPLISGLPDSQ